MLETHSRALDAVLRISDLALLALALPIVHAAHALLPGAHWAPTLHELWPALVIALVLWVPSAWFSDLYGASWCRPFLSEVGRVQQALTLVGVALGSIAFLVKDMSASRLLFVLYFAVAFALLVVLRATLRLVARLNRRRGYHVRRYAVVGDGQLADEIVAKVRLHPEWNMDLAGYVVARDRAPRGKTILGTLDELDRILEEHVIDEVIFAIPRDGHPRSERAVENAIRVCEELGVGVRISLGVLRYGTHSKVAVGEMHGLPMVSLYRTPSDGLALAVKRMFDIAVSAAVLVLAAPVFAAIALVIKLDSRGPVFFRQRRVGLNGREFTMLKFRSMHVDAEQRLEALRAHNEMSGPVFKMKDDPRITRAGKWLRKTSLDELPQFVNVLTGEMSVVGPRPPLRSEVRKYQRWHRRRLSVKPGITCTWQVSGRNGIDFDQWMELDLQYIDRWSLWHDLAICLKTVPAVLSARGAH